MPYRAIETHYLGHSSARSARIIAKDWGGMRLTHNISGRRGGEELHYEAAQLLADRMGWEGELVCGETKRGYVFVIREGPRELTLEERL